MNGRPAYGGLDRKNRRRRRLGTLARAAILVAAALCAICSPRVYGLEVDFDNCREVLRDGPVCALATSSEGYYDLRLYVHPFEKGPPIRRLRIFGGGSALGSYRVGELLPHLRIASGAPWVQVRGWTDSGLAVWSLELAPFSRSPWLADASRIAGRDPTTVLERAAADPIAEERGDALHLMARLAPEIDEKVRLYGQAEAAHRSAGQVHGQIASGVARAQMEIQRRRFRQARAILQDLQDLPYLSALPTSDRLLIGYAQAVRARRLGDLRKAFGSFASLEDETTRYLIPGLHHAVEQEHAMVLGDMGRWREAKELAARDLEAIDRACSHPGAQGCEAGESVDCKAGDLLTTEGWSLLMARESGMAVFEDPLPLLLRAQLISEGEDCRAGQSTNTTLNLALAYLQNRDARRARELLEDSRLAALKDPEQELWKEEEEARLALLEGRALAALQEFVELEREAIATLSREIAWRARVGQAQAYVALGRTGEALAAFAAAFAQVEDESLAVPIAEGRESFVAMRDAATSDYLDFLLRTNRAREAFAVLRIARARFLRQLERTDQIGSGKGAQARLEDSAEEYRSLRNRYAALVAQEWSLGARQDQARREKEELSRKMKAAIDGAVETGRPGSTELARLVEGEVVLAYYRLRSGTWIGLAVDESGAKPSRFELSETALDRPSAQLSQLLLAPFRDAIRRARRVRVLATGALQRVDFHALPFDGDALVATKPVVYGLDLATSDQESEKGSRRALVVGDPLGNLEAARNVEAPAVQKELTGAGWKVQPLLQEAARAEAVKGFLQSAQLFHFAGHAWSVGFGGWDSHLALAADDQLTVGDVLLLDSSPPWVVLAGCETGKTEVDTPLESLGLAQAFLLAGARSVVAATRHVDSRFTAELFSEFYKDWSDEPDLAARLRTAQLALHRKYPASSEWAAFRVYER